MAHHSLILFTSALLSGDTSAFRSSPWSKILTQSHPVFSAKLTTNHPLSDCYIKANTPGTRDLEQPVVGSIAMAGFWKVVQTGFAELEGSENRIPDICKWVDATLLLSPRAHRYLGESLADFGEFLPVIIEGETYQLFNCLATADVIEKESSESNLALDQNSVADKMVFKSPYQCCIDVFCTDRLKDVVESAQLSGIYFDARLASTY